MLRRRTDPRPSREERRARRRELAKGADLSTVGLVFPVAAVLGLLLGGWIGGFFDAAATGGLIGMLVGVVSGFYNLLKVTLRLRREDDEPGGSGVAPGDRGAGDRGDTAGRGRGREPGG